VVVPIGEYRQLRLAMREQQVNEEFDAARVRYLARREAGAAATCRPSAMPDPRLLPVGLDELAGVLEGDPMYGGGHADLATGEVGRRLPSIVRGKSGRRMRMNRTILISGCGCIARVR
jgi:hypothetical protein